MNRTQISCGALGGPRLLEFGYDLVRKPKLSELVIRRNRVNSRSVPARCASNGWRDVMLEQALDGTCVGFLRTKSFLLRLMLGASRIQEILKPDRQVADPFPRRMIDRVCNGCVGPHVAELP